MHAINASTFLGKASLFALDVAKVAMNGENEYLESAGKYLVQPLPDAYKPSTPIFECEGLLAKMRKSGGE
ncbi:hypothetical protein [Novosphingobium sp.]|uniref:hypothetical protein n=1 Tax=Novosphingobium sp. TaxID=1874826 RepID=UPI002FDF8718